MLTNDYITELRSRGFKFSDSRKTGHSRAKLEHYIPAIGQARFHDYTHPFRPALDGGREVGVDHVLRLYRFDRKLRLLALDASERIEIALKSALETQLSNVYGDKWHANRQLLNSLSPDLYTNLKSDVSRSPLMKALVKDGKGYSDFPTSRVLDNISFGRAEFLLKTLPSGGPLTEISRHFGLVNRVFLSWVSTTRTVRNTAAHHSRLWNRRLQSKPLIPASIITEIGDVPHDFHEKFYGAAVVLNGFASSTARNSQWRVRLRHLIEENNIGHLNLKEAMGFPYDWWETEFWK